MSLRVVICFLIGLPFCKPTPAHGCDPSLSNYIHAIEILIDVPAPRAVRPLAIKPRDEKIHWMQDELGLILDACSRGRDVEAVWRIEQVQMTVAGNGKPDGERPFRSLPGRTAAKRSLLVEARMARR